jgi:hypothetical protein
MSGSVSKRGRELLAKLVKESPLFVEGPELRTARALERLHLLVVVNPTADDRHAAMLLGPGRRWLRKNHPELVVSRFDPPPGAVQWLRAVIRAEISEMEGAEEVEKRWHGDSHRRLSGAVLSAAKMLVATMSDDAQAKHRELGVELGLAVSPIDDEAQELGLRFRALVEKEKW